MGGKTFHRYKPSAILFISKAQGSRVSWGGTWSKGEREGEGLWRLEERREERGEGRKNTATSEASAGRLRASLHQGAMGEHRRGPKHQYCLGADGV